MPGMNLFRMRGAWNPVHAWLFDFFVSRGMTPLHERIAERVGPRLPETGKVLDVGCGAGRATILLARRTPGVRFVGADLSATMIGMARREAGALSNVSFRVGDAMDLPFGDGEFDAALSVASIKHWPDQARGVREMARVVRPGGTVLVIEADRRCDAGRVERFIRLWRFVPSPLLPVVGLYFRRFVAAQGIDRDDLRRHLEAAGLADVEGTADEEAPAVYAHGRRPVTPPAAGAG
jgi:ubiquinone/menaquinone biosynthesis C-methylase UbiE